MFPRIHVLFCKMCGCCTCSQDTAVTCAQYSITVPLNYFLQAHLQVALQMLKANKPVNIGDHIPYVICTQVRLARTCCPNSTSQSTYHQFKTVQCVWCLHAHAHAHAQYHTRTIYFIINQFLTILQLSLRAPRAAMQRSELTTPTTSRAPSLVSDCVYSVINYI